MRHIFRSRIKTHNERKQVEISLYYGIKVRGRRKVKSLCNAWDDISISAIKDRSWKRYRRFRYKSKEL